jgi:integrase/recombinase XerC
VVDSHEEVFTVGHLRESFLRHVGLLVQAGVNEEGTHRWYRDQLKHLDPLADFPADALRTHHLSTVPLTTGVTRAIKRLYRWGAEEELVPRDPFRKLSIPPCGERQRVLTRTDLAKLYLASPRPLRRLLFVQLRTFARPGEVRTLTWGQSDVEKRAIVLLSFKGKKRRRDKLRARLIPLDLVVVRMLLNLHRKSPDSSAEGSVFRSTRHGRPWTYNAVRCAIRRARVKAGLDDGDEPVVCYHLRHTAATRAVPHLNLKVIAEIMGHARTSTTERYLHLNGADLVEAIDRLQRSRELHTR